MKHKILTDHHLQALAALLAADMALFGLVDPTDAAALWLIIGFMLLGVTLFCIASLMARSLRSFGDEAARKTWRLMRYGVLVLIVLIGLQSIGQLTIKDVLTLAPCVGLAYLYFGYNKRQRMNERASSP